MTNAAPDSALTYALAVDLCSHWKEEKGKSMLSVEDLILIREWIVTSSCKILKYPSLLPLASRGLDDLIAESACRNVSAANLLRL